MEYFIITRSQIKDAVVKGSNVFYRVSVRTGPFIVVELVLEYFTVEKTADENTLFDEDVDIL